MILLWGLEDSSMNLVRTAIEEMRAPFLFLNHADLLDTHVEVEYSPDVTGIIEVRGTKIQVEAIRSIYLRPYDFKEFPEFANLDRESPQYRHAQLLQSILWSLSDVADGLVLNRPSSMLSNSSKPYQSRLIEAQGFKVPETLITTDPSVARRFRVKHGDVVYKSISGTRSIVKRLSDEHEARMEDLRWCPTQFQVYVEGVDYRVHVVSSRLHATRIVSDAVDYRYGPSRIDACELPDDVAERCFNLTQAMGLIFSGIDLRRTPSGQWFCFEVNPSPAYSCYEEITGQKMSLDVANLLASYDRA